MLHVFKDKRSIYGAFKQFNDPDTLYTASEAMKSTSSLSKIFAWALIISGICCCLLIILAIFGIPMIILGVYMLRKLKSFKTNLEEAYQQRLSELQPTIH